MRVDVTPLGAISRPVAAVARAVVDYLEGPSAVPGAALLASPGDAGVAAYFGDSAEGPGRWVGAGAAYHGLAGTVERQAFERLLEGRHPVSGARLVAARGSSQRGHLAVGSAARFDEHGDPVYDVADTAALLGLSGDDVTAMVSAWRPDSDPGDPAVLRTITIGGVAYVPDAEIERHLELVACPPAAQRIRAAGHADDELSVEDAAAELGVSIRYVRRLCSNAIEASGEAAGAARLPASKSGPHGSWRIRRGDLAEFAAARRPPVARVGFDVTVTVEKSFAVVTMLADPEVQRRFVAALDTANTTALEHLDRHGAVARRRGAVVATEGLIGASYFHATSRALDPHPHRHNVIANAVVDDEGGIRTLDARALFRHAAPAAALATAAARWELRDLGLGWWQRDDGIWEIAGVDEATIAEFSTRHHDIAEIKQSLERTLGRTISTAEDHHVWADTRDDKTAVEPEALLADWRDRADRVGFDVDACFDRPDRAVAFETLPPDRVRQLFAQLADPDRGVCAGRDRFDHGDVLRAVADWSLPDLSGGERKVLLPPTEIEALAGRFLASEHVVVLDAALGGGVIRRRDGTVIDDGQGQRCYSTVEMLRTQQRLLEGWRRGRNVGRGVVDAATVDAVLAGADLSDEQQNLVRVWCGSGDLAQGAIGRAGTGKTTTMRAAAATWRAAGYRVIGAAVKAEAARQLGADADIDADTVALLLARARRDPYVLDARTVLIVDEGSTLGDRDLATLVDLAEQQGATLRIIGDPAQHQSVPAGGCWSYLVTREASAELTTVHRLTDPGERSRAEAIRDGRIDEAIAALVDSGQLELSASDADTYARVLSRWLSARDDGATHPIVHGRNSERHVLNRLAQHLLIDTGDVDPTRAITLADGRRLCVGDEVIARRGHRHIHPEGSPAGWLRNGTLGTITDILHGDTAVGDIIEIATPAGLVRCPRRVFDRGIDHSYAVTSYAMQGATREQSTAIVTSTTNRAELYVDVTRGRHSNQLYGTRTHTPGDDSDRHLPRLSRDLVDDLAANLARGTGTPAAAADPLAARIANRPQRRTLAALSAARAAGDDIADGELERAAAATRAGATVPNGFAAVLPPLQAPHLRRRRDELAGDVAVHHASHNAPRHRPTTPLGNALGARPSNTVARRSWDDLAERLIALAVDAALTRLAPGTTNWRRNDPWVASYLGQLAGNGDLACIDPVALIGRLDSIAGWRDDHHMTSSLSDSPLGQRPTTPSACADYDRLARSIEPRRRTAERSIA